ncbi:hypothetical protein GJV76_15180 [Myroides sp. BIT-d1]|uniref:Rod shape-determining protein MreD n=2 Tax=Myroides albus TaxID=2562892 RepID=A0A6I3LM48_9FLAO|nr:hypothetical protein [Myroides albus]
MSRFRLDIHINKTHLFFHWILFVLISFVQTAVSMYTLRDRPSGDITFNFYQDVLVGALIVSVFYSLLLLVVLRIQSFGIQVVIHSLIVIVLWFYEDLLVFGDREAGWSTYSLKASIVHTLQLSVIPIVISLLVYLPILYCLRRKV